MDAETMLNELIGNASVAGYLTASDQSPNENFRKVYALRIQILLLIRAGLALQRLEAAEPSRVKITDGLTGWNATIELQHGEGHGSWGPSIADAINAALDAAGEGI